MSVLAAAAPARDGERPLAGPAPPARVVSVRTRGFRNLADATTGLAPGINVAYGANGAGKTNLLEAAYFALVGRSCRTANDRELIRFGESLVRSEARVRGEAEEHDFLASYQPGADRRHLRDGAPIESADLTARPPVAVFMPDRLALVKGAPAARRAHLDRFVAALWPARSVSRQRFGSALAQRNALLARIRAGSASRASLAAWDAELADAATSLIAARAAAVAALAAPFAAAARDLGLPDPARIAYRPRSETREPEQLARELAARRERDIERARTTHGPHLDDVALSLEGRSLRRYGSQGQQRAALLALLFAEREVLLAERATAPLMLLDDVMSELDPGRRELLVATLSGGGQTLITATHRSQLPEGPRLELELKAGRVSESSSQ